MHIEKDQIQIVRIQAQNYPAFCKLLEWRRTGQKDGDTKAYHSEQVAGFFQTYQILDSDQFFIFAAQYGEEFVGYINAVLIPKPDPRLGILYVDELWVPEVYRRNGIAELLIDEIHQFGKEKNLWRIRLFTETDNLIGRSFYQKVGYQEKGDAIFCELDL